MNYDNNIIGSQKNGNIAIKCNYCDGGKDADHIGFDGVCSDRIIRYNIEEEHRVWCSNDRCPCFQYHNRRITRNRLEEIMTTPSEFVCYESTMLSDWKTQAGLFEDGRTKSFGSTLHKGAVCIFTTRLPDMDERNRFVFGLFIIDELFHGDDNQSGYVKCNTDYHIELSPDEAKKLKFWNYYRNKNTPEKELWGTGLYRFISNNSIIMMLTDLISMRTSEKMNEAVRFLTEFCRLNNLRIPDIVDNDGSFSESTEKPIVSFSCGGTYNLVMKSSVHAHPIKKGFPSKISRYLMVRATGGTSEDLFEVEDTIDLNPMDAEAVNGLPEKYSAVRDYIRRRTISFGFKNAPLPYRFYLLKSVMKLSPAYVMNPNPQGFRYLSFDDIGFNPDVLEHRQIVLEDQMIEKEIEAKQLVGEDRTAVVKARINQSVFRERLMRKYGKCFLCGVDEESLLIASHIKPWTDSNPEERVDEYNGLLLCPNHDKLFDRGYISFDDDGRIMISKVLSENNRVFLNINSDNSIEMDDITKSYMKYHREKVFIDREDEELVEALIDDEEPNSNETSAIPPLQATKLGPLPDSLIGFEVEHVGYGDGVIKSIDSRSFQIEVKFEDHEDPKTFVFPGCFLSGKLILKNDEDQLGLEEHLKKYKS